MYIYYIFIFDNFQFEKDFRVANTFYFFHGIVNIHP